MKSEIIISIGLILLGFIFECLHFLTDIRFFEIKLSILGIVSIAIGVVGILWYFVVPLLEKRAEVLGEFKKGKIKNNQNS